MVRSDQLLPGEHLQCVKESVTSLDQPLLHPHPYTDKQLKKLKCVSKVSG